MRPTKPIDDIMLLMEQYAISPYTVLDLILRHLSDKEIANMLEFLYNEVQQFKLGSYYDY